MRIYRSKSKKDIAKSETNSKGYSMNATSRTPLNTKTKRVSDCIKNRSKFLKQSDEYPKRNQDYSLKI